MAKARLAPRQRAAGQNHRAGRAGGPHREHILSLRVWTRAKCGAAYVDTLSCHHRLPRYCHRWFFPYVTSCTVTRNMPITFDTPKCQVRICHQYHLDVHRWVRYGSALDCLSMFISSWWALRPGRVESPRRGSSSYLHRGHFGLVESIQRVQPRGFPFSAVQPEGLDSLRFGRIALW